MGAADVLADHAGGQAEGGVVGAAHHFVLVVVGEDAHHRPEDLFLDDGHVIAAVGEHGRQHVGAIGQRAFGGAAAAGQQAGAFGLAAFDVAQHVFHVREAGQRAEVGLGGHRVADADALDALDNSGFERGQHAARHEHAGTVGADLAGAEEVGHHRDVGGAVEVGVIADHQRRLAAQFHGHFLQRRGRGAGHDLLAGGDAAGEGDLLDHRVLGQPLADLAARALHHVEHAGGHAGFGVDLGQPDRGQRGHFGRLEHHRVARGQRRGRLPHGDLDRVVPGTDAGDHAQRFASGIEEARFAQRQLDTFDGGGQAGVVLDHVGAGDDVHGGGFGQRLAGVQGFQVGQFVVALAQELDGTAQDARTLHGRHRGPHLLAFGCALHGTFDVGLAGDLHFSDHLAGGRVDGLEGLAAGGIDALAVDVELLYGQGGHGAYSLEGGGC